MTMTRTTRWRRHAITSASTVLLALSAVVAAPTAANAADGVITITSSSMTSSATPTISGTYDIGATETVLRRIDVVVDGEVVCQIPLESATGTYSCLLTTSLDLGEHSVEAWMVRGFAGSLDPEWFSVTQTLTYALPAPVAASITITSSDTVSTSLPTIAGTFDRGSSTSGDARLLVIVAGATVCDQALESSSGTFSCTVTSALNADRAALVVVRLNVVDGSSTTVIAQTTQSLSYSPPVVNPSVTITSADTTSSARPTMTGTLVVGTWASLPNSNLEVYLGGSDVPTCSWRLTDQAVGAGTFQCTPATDLAPGTYAVFVVLHSDVSRPMAASASASQTLTITGGDTATGDPTITIASANSTTAAKPTFSGTFSLGREADRSDKFTVTVLVDDYPVCDESGDYLDLDALTWSCQSDTELDDGPHTVTARLLYNGISYDDLWPTSVANQELTVSLGATITGHVFTDLNGNGVQDAGEPDISNVTVQLWKLTEDETYAMVATTVTHSPYRFTGVAPGIYQVRVPAGTTIAGYAPLTSAMVWTVTVTGAGTYTASASSFGLTPTGSSLASTGVDAAGVAGTALRVLMFGLVLLLGATLVRRRQDELA